MSLKVLIVADKFKGTLTAPEAVAAIARGWRLARPTDRVETLPMSDGGDGFGEVVSLLMKARPQQTITIDAAHRPVKARWFWEPQSRTAIIESASVIGLAQLPKSKFHPFQLDTFGLGAVLKAAARRRPRRVLLGIGGSATNDGGFGLARALGWKFLNAQGEPLERWTDLPAARRLVPPARKLALRKIIVAVDVQNPLLGPRGATRIYGPQKGIRPQDVEMAEACLRQLAKLSRQHLKREHRRKPGTGAAGGLGFGLRAFAGAELAPGFELFAKLAGLQTRLKMAGLVITAEGSIDHSSMMGKGPGEIARCCQELGIPCLGLAGVVRDGVQLKKHFVQLHALTPGFVSVRRAFSAPGPSLCGLAAHAAQRWERGG